MKRKIVKEAKGSGVRRETDEPFQGKKPVGLSSNLECQKGR